MSQEDDLIRAREAQALLSDPLLKQAFKDIEDHYVTIWKSTTPSQYELREECHNSLYSLEQLKRQLHSYVETGKLLQAAFNGVGKELGGSKFDGTSDYASRS